MYKTQKPMLKTYVAASRAPAVFTATTPSPTLPKVPLWVYLLTFAGGCSGGFALAYFTARALQALGVFQ